MAVLFESILLAALVVVSAFFAASETSFLSVSPVKMQSLLERKVKGAENLARLRANRRRVVISLLIGNNIANVAASALATSIAIALFGEAGIGYAVGIMSFILLTFGDIAPKSAATSYGEKIAVTFAPIIETFYWISYPLVLVFEALNRVIPGVYSRATGLERFTEEEVRSAVKLGAKHKGISEKEKELIENVLAFNDRSVGDAMTPKSRVVWLPADTLIVIAHRKAVECAYSRFPVLNEKGVAVGITGIKTISRTLYEHPEWKLKDIVAEPINIKQSEKTHNAFATLQKLGRNFAIVVNDKGEFAGIITLEDLLEELVGEIK